MFGRKTAEQKAAERQITALALEAKVKRGIFYYEKYLGGHEMYPVEQPVYIWIFPERMEITPLGIKIPFTKLKNIEGIYAGKTGWREHIHTELEYVDELGTTRKIRMNFGQNTQYIQPMIYEHMVAARKITN